jgi:hypothetical protein
MNEGRVLPAFIAAMVWGSGTTAGMGALRTRWMVTQTKTKGRVRHLRSSYFTKWLHFTSSVDGPDDPNAAPILDDRIVGWLKDPAGVPLEKNCTDSYGEYVDLLASWGEPYGRTRAQVETEIFQLATGRR